MEALKASVASFLRRVEPLRRIRDGKKGKRRTASDNLQLKNYNPSQEHESLSVDGVEGRYIEIAGCASSQGWSGAHVTCGARCDSFGSCPQLKLRKYVVPSPSQTQLHESIPLVAWGFTSRGIKDRRTVRLAEAVVSLLRASLFLRP